MFKDWEKKSPLRFGLFAQRGWWGGFLLLHRSVLSVEFSLWKHLRSSPYRSHANLKCILYYTKLTWRKLNCKRTSERVKKKIVKAEQIES